MFSITRIFCLYMRYTIKCEAYLKPKPCTPYRHKVKSVVQKRVSIGCKPLLFLSKGQLRHF